MLKLMFIRLIKDPAIEARLLDAELYEWYGSAALPAYLDTHDKIFKRKTVIQWL